MRKMILAICVIQCLFVSLHVRAQNGFFDGFLNSTLLIEKEEANGVRATHGTGFLIYNYQDPGNTFLVTCAHLLRRSNIYVKLPLTDSGIIFMDQHKIKKFVFEGREWLREENSIVTRYDLVPGKTFFTNDSLDIGVLKIVTGLVFGDTKDTVFLTANKSIPASQIQQRTNTTVGTSVYFVGFPHGIGGKSGYHNSGLFADIIANPLLRKGIVAWKSNKNESFLIDGFSYGGNSGSPVFTETSVSGKSKPSLIGMVQGHLSDPRFNPSEVDFNQGLARCVWVDEIMKVIEKLK